MNTLIVFGLIFAFSSAIGSPLPAKIDHKWRMVPDGNGNMHLVDINTPVVEIEPMFNAESDTRFLLFTRSNPTAAQQITWTSESIQGSNFNSNHQVRFLIHGWNSDPSSGVNIAPTRNYLTIGDYNVIVVDWSAGAGTINYVSARNRVAEVADVTARLINFLTSNGFTQTNDIIIAGHSLGGHIAGLTGKRTNGRLNTIFALDPAGPLFDYEPAADRFDADDADYTQGIRTNAGFLGFDTPLAHADFYPNWGRGQPGCGIDATATCAHGRAHEFFAESILSNGFVGIHCPGGYDQILNTNCPGTDRALMGGDVWNRGVRGVYFVETNSNSPFSRG